MRQQGRILGIGGIFFKSANQQQMKEWYAKHLGLGESGHDVMLPWREKDNPENEQVTVWSIFPATTKYFEPSSASFMLNYIVDDIDALLERLAAAGERPTRSSREAISIGARVSPRWRGPNEMFAETVPGNRKAVCMTMPTRRRSSCGAMER